jgi:phosphate transport system protein
LTQAAVTRSNTQPEQGRGTTTALVEDRVRLAERIVAAELGSAGPRSPADSTATQVSLLHAPVAGDLRTVVAAIRSGDDLERMEVLARHVA